VILESSEHSQTSRQHYVRGLVSPVALPTAASEIVGFQIRASEVRALGTVSSWWADADRQRLRRALNVLVAVVGLVLALPLMIVIALAIKVTSPGPIIFTQTRVGLDRRTPGVPAGNWRRGVDHGGRLFTLYKFRTMHADSGRAQVWASPDDPRVTRVGHVLRKFRLDELPQLFNVLKGDMNVVGPRPEQPAIFSQLRAEIGSYPARQRVLPGITGWAQVNQHYDQTIADVRTKVELDLHYIGKQSVAEDLKILMRTVPTVLFGRGAW
jgi:lipopolysaccharide/colanic/teichoic acid biosynthesis glycosyltransferase